MPAGFSWVARVAPFRGRGWLSAGLYDYELAYWSQTCRMSQSVGAEPGRVCFQCLPGGVAWIAVGCSEGAVCLTCRRVNAPNDMFYFLCFIMSHYIYTQRVDYICMSYYISTQRVCYICSFTISLYIFALHFCHYLWSYTCLGLMLFVVKTT